jgi:hypothetical protein
MYSPLCLQRSVDDDLAVVRIHPGQRALSATSLRIRQQWQSTTAFCVLT